MPGFEPETTSVMNTSRTTEQLGLSHLKANARNKSWILRLKEATNPKYNLTTSCNNQTNSIRFIIL